MPREIWGSLSHSDTLHLVLGFIVETLWVEGKNQTLESELSNPSASYPHPSNLQPLLPLQQCVLIENYFALSPFWENLLLLKRYICPTNLVFVHLIVGAGTRRQIWVVKLFPFAYLQTLNLEDIGRRHQNISPPGSWPCILLAWVREIPWVIQCEGTNSIPTGSRAAYAKKPRCPVAVH